MNIEQQHAIRIATDFLGTEGYRVVPTVEGLSRVEGEWLVEYDECHFLDYSRHPILNSPKQYWSVIFRDQLPPDLLTKDPSGPVVLVDAETGSPILFPVL